MKLIIIHGPSGSGKSSVAESLHKTLPSLSLLLKFDTMRRFLTNRHENSVEAGNLTNKICEAMVEACLKEDRDVIFERAIKDPAVLDGFINLGKSYGAEVYEFLLWADKETILGRNATRADASDFVHDSRRITFEKATEFWKKINGYKDRRTNATIIDVGENNLDQVVKKIAQIIHG